jgi:hypothetical protein
VPNLALDPVAVRTVPDRFGGMAMVSIVSLLLAVGLVVPDPGINPAMICRVQHAIRWMEPLWTVEQCETRAFDFTGSADRWGLSSSVLFAIAINESDLRTKVVRLDHGALDLGLMAVRCHLGLRGKCTNKPIKGMTPAQVMRPATNIEKSAEILATLHGGDLSSYNGGPRAREHGYPEKIRAILSALVGVEVKVKGKRMRELVRRIVQVARPPES